jgi:RNA polymerase sigma factor (sigma-70 family)
VLDEPPEEQVRPQGNALLGCPSAQGICRVTCGKKPWEVTPEEIILKQELRSRLEEAIQALPKHYRLVLILRDMEQLDTREVAEVMGISEDTTKMRLHRARVFVRNALAGYLQHRGDGEKKGHA